MALKFRCLFSSLIWTTLTLFFGIVPVLVHLHVATLNNLPTPQFIDVVREGVPAAIILTLGTATAIDLYLSGIPIEGKVGKALFGLVPLIIVGYLLLVMDGDYNSVGRNENVPYLKTAYVRLFEVSLVFCISARAMLNFQLEQEK